MLNQLNIRNLAVVDAVELEFGTGFTVLTGETGAGKSILVDALALALGARADSSAIRSGTDRCEITAAFTFADREDLLRRLADEDLDDGDECLIRRIVTREGRSRGYINGHQVPMQTLRELAPQLVDICGQQSHQSLRHAAVQRAILDHFGDSGALADKMGAIYDEWTGTRDRVERLRASLADREARLELLKYQVGELEALNLQPGEFAQTEQEHRLVANSARIAEGLAATLGRLYENDDATAHSLISASLATLEELVEFDPEFAACAELLREAQISVSEAANALRNRTDSVEHDPRRQLYLEQRLSSIVDLARKHEVEPEQLPELAIRLSAELDAIEQGDEKLDELSALERRLERETRSIAAELTQARTGQATKLADAVTAHMQSLGIPEGQFSVRLSSQPGGSISRHGADRIEFQVAANPGQAPGPLAKVASGGELSRISLSIQVVALAVDTVPSLIFDEVDAGVGGGVAEMVGQRLRELASDRQVLCVTHLPQVASLANHHFRVAKISDGVDTRTTVTQLNDKARVDEVARMLGGVEITRRTREHAKEMLSGAAARKVG